MFYHIFKYRLKCILRDKSTMFWTLMFPIILATLFNLSLSNMHTSEDFSKINIAIVEEGEYNNEKNKDFLDSIEAMSDDSDKDSLFKVRYESEEKAKNLLDNNKIDGYLFFDGEINIAVKDSGMNQTILKSFVDEYKQTESTLKNIMTKDPSMISRENIEKLIEKNDYIEEVSVTNSSLSEVVNYFYTLIAMACFYGGFLGLKEVAHIQANQSYQGARISIAPTNKLKAYLASMSAAIIVQLFDIGILIAYLNFVLNVSFSNRLGYVLLSCVVGTIAGVSFGACIGAILKCKEGTKIGVLMGSTMTMSFFAGMMYDKMKLIVNQKSPILGYINPVNLIADSLYSLYYYDTLTKYFFSITVLCGISAVFIGITYLVIRRQKYASL